MPVFYRVAHGSTFKEMRFLAHFLLLVCAAALKVVLSH